MLAVLAVDRTAGFVLLLTVLVVLLASCSPRAAARAAARAATRVHGSARAPSAACPFAARDGEGRR